MALVSILGLSISCGGSSTPSTSVPATTQAQGKAQILRLAYFMSPSMDEGLFIENLAAEFNKQFAGRYEIKSFPNETLVKMTESMDATRIGMTELCIYPFRVFTAVEPAFGAAEVPLLYTSIESLNNTFAVLTPEFSKLMEQKYNQKTLTMYTLGFLELCSPKKNVKTLEDWKGLLVAALSPPAQGLVTSLGGSAISIPPMEGYSSLEKGVVEASNQSLMNMDQVKLFEVAPFVTSAFLLPSGIGLNMNLDVYNKLPADVQQAIVKLGEDFAVQSAAYQLEKEVRAREMLTAEGCTIYNVPGAERQKWVDALKAFNDSKLPSFGNIGPILMQTAAEQKAKYPYPY
ncbi:MAG: TRAP transporter substrate-binding protein DctP [Dehalococcoidales bacterium]|nr:TRAP transporter substrate-binding protein DctP [Dehalococcoidales bacterium]